MLTHPSLQGRINWGLWVGQLAFRLSWNFQDFTIPFWKKKKKRKRICIFWGGGKWNQTKTHNEEIPNLSSVSPHSQYSKGSHTAFHEWVQSCKIQLFSGQINTVITKEFVILRLSLLCMWQFIFVFTESPLFLVNVILSFTSIHARLY